MTEDRSHTGAEPRGRREEHVDRPGSRPEARPEEPSIGAADPAVEREAQGGGESSEHLETRLPLEPGDGPGSPQGDALLDGSGSRHGVDARDERPGTD